MGDAENKSLGSVANSQNNNNNNNQSANQNIMNNLQQQAQQQQAHQHQQQNGFLQDQYKQQQQQSQGIFDTVQRQKEQEQERLRSQLYNQHQYYQNPNAYNAPFTTNNFAMQYGYQGINSFQGIQPTQKQGTNSTTVRERSRANPGSQRLHEPIS